MLDVKSCLFNYLVNSLSIVTNCSDLKFGKINMFSAKTLLLIMLNAVKIASVSIKYCALWSKKVTISLLLGDMLANELFPKLKYDKA